MVNEYIDEIEKPSNLRKYFREYLPGFTGQFFAEILLFFRRELKNADSYLRIFQNIDIKIQRIKRPTEKMVSYARDLSKKLSKNINVELLSYDEL